jgi:hypothetical protein
MTVMVLPALRLSDPQALSGDHDDAVGADHALRSRDLRWCRTALAHRLVAGPRANAVT